MKTTMIQAATEMGKKAFLDGKKCVPALDPNVKDLIKLCGADTKKACRLLTAWMKGWTCENLKAPVLGL